MIMTERPMRKPKPLIHITVLRAVYLYPISTAQQWTHIMSRKIIARHIPPAALAFLYIISLSASGSAIDPSSTSSRMSQ